MRRACAYTHRRQVTFAAVCVRRALRLALSQRRARSLDAWCTRQYDYYQRVVNGRCFTDCMQSFGY